MPRKVGFVAPLAAARVPAGLFAALPPGAGTAVDYTAGRDAGKPAAARGIYRVLEDGGMDLAGPRKATRRCICAGSWSTPQRTPPGGQGPRAEARQGHRGAEPAGAHRRDPVSPHPTPSPPASRRSPPNGASRHTCAPRSPGTPGKPALSWHFDQAAIDAEAAADGWYALLTNLEPAKPAQQRSSAATRASTSSNAATASSKAPSRSPPCS